MTNAQIAKMSGIPLSTIDKITSGVSKNPKFDTLQAICRTLGCSLNDFMDNPPINSSPLSDAALQLAQDYDRLDSFAQKHIRFITDIELERLNTPHPPV